MRLLVVLDLAKRGQSFKDFGDYGQKGVRAKSNEKEVAHIVERWGIEFDPLIARIASELKAGRQTGITLSTEERKGSRLNVRQIRSGVEQNLASSTTLQVQGNRVKSIRELRAGGGSSISSTLEMDMKRLNSMANLVENGWAGDVGEQEFGFMGRMVNRIETLIADEEPTDTGNEFDEALANFKQSPTAENLELLRATDPVAVANAERRNADRLKGVNDGQ